MDFFVPPSLKQDFDSFLLSNACHNISFCHDVLANEPIWITERAEITKNSSKQRTYDKGLKLTVSHDTQIQKGDIVLYKDKFYLVTLNINENQLNAKTTSMELVSTPITFMRRSEDEIDENDGTIIQKGGYNQIFKTIRGILTNSGSVSYSVGTSNAGLFPSNSIFVYLQANESTLQLKCNDSFTLFNSTFIIRSVLYTELNYDQVSGILILQVENTSVGDFNGWYRIQD